MVEAQRRALLVVCAAWLGTVAQQLYLSTTSKQGCLYFERPNLKAIEEPTEVLFEDMMVEGSLVVLAIESPS